MDDTAESYMESSSSRGFTLIEVLVALAIFALSAALLLRALNATSVSSRRLFQRGLLESFAISKMDAILSGTEKRSGGKVEAVEGTQWQLRKSLVSEAGGAPLIQRLDLQIIRESDPQAKPIHLWAFTGVRAGR